MLKAVVYEEAILDTDLAILVYNAFLILAQMVDLNACP